MSPLTTNFQSDDLAYSAPQTSAFLHVNNTSVRGTTTTKEFFSERGYQIKINVDINKMQNESNILKTNRELNEKDL